MHHLGVAIGGGTGSRVAIPIGGTLSNLDVTFSNYPGSSQSYTATLVANGMSTGMAESASADGSGTVTLGDMTYTDTVCAGAALFLQVISSFCAASIAGLYWGFTITRLDRYSWSQYASECA